MSILEKCFEFGQPYSTKCTQAITQNMIVMCSPNPTGVKINRGCCHVSSIKFCGTCQNDVFKHCGNMNWSLVVCIQAHPYLLKTRSFETYFQSFKPNCLAHLDLCLRYICRSENCASETLHEWFTRPPPVLQVHPVWSLLMKVGVFLFRDLSVYRDHSH